MKISLVIPVYNEAENLRACLMAVAAQTKLPHQVIVVDNNSTDGTTLIAEDFSFVTLIKEPKQGVVHARTRGFDKANGDIIARIDADSIIPEHWLETVEKIFSDKTIDAVNGVALYYGVAAANLVDSIDLFVRRRLSTALKRQNNMYLWGANMAMRRECWQEVKSYLCQRSHQHEDFDIAIHMQELGRNIVFDENLKAFISSRRIDMRFMDYMRYVMMSPNTFAQHDIKVKKQMYPVVAICAVCYIPGYLLYKGYDPITDRFSLGRLIMADKTLQRVDPTTYVA
jgi:glycosyltransferase involved in cell wall biosynthesis